MTWRELCMEGTRLLVSCGIEEAENDARELVLTAGRMSLGVYARRSDEEADESAVKACRAMFARRASREPLQYIKGKTWFFGHEFSVDRRVLIPRFDTEVLVDAVLGQMPEGGDDDEPVRILDLCTGSGCILLTLMEEAKRPVEGTGTDISSDALEVAALNAERLGLEPDFLCGDLFSPVRGHFDIITANPPYIPTADIEGLAEEVSAHEPREALDGAADGLHFYRRIAAAAPDYLVRDGLLAVEIGFDQAEAVSALMAAAGFGEIKVIRDLSGLDRVVTGVLRQA